MVICIVSARVGIRMERSASLDFILIAVTQSENAKKVVLMPTVTYQMP